MTALRDDERSGRSCSGVYFVVFPISNRKQTSYEIALIYGHIWPYAWAMARGNAYHIYLDNQQAFILDAIGVAMGKRRLGVEASRSQLISTAVRNFIEDCTVEEDLREAIAEARSQLATGKGSPHAT